MIDDHYRELALEFPGVVESSHMNHPDFRVGGRIFATLGSKHRRGGLKLMPEQQEILMDAHPHWFTPAEGAWGRRGWTYVGLDGIDEETLRSALLMAWRNTAPRKVVADYEQANS
jgi:hypothetical protein